MASTTFSGPVTSTNGFIGEFTGGTTNLELTGTLSVGTTSTLTGAVSAPAGVTGNLTGNVTGTLTSTTSTSAALGAVGNAVNTAGKALGTTLYNTTTKTFYVAQGALAASTWIDSSDGTTTITPA